MNDAWGDKVTERSDSAMSAAAEEHQWSGQYQEFQRHQHEAERWHRRVELAERHQEFALATEAAQRARRHAGLALAAERQVAEHQVQRGNLQVVLSEEYRLSTAAGVQAAPRRHNPETAASIDARLAAIKARQRATMSGREE